MKNKITTLIIAFSWAFLVMCCFITVKQQEFIVELYQRLTALEQEVDSVKDTQVGIVTWAGEVTREVNSNTAKLGQDGVYYQLTAPICYECHR